MTDNGEVTKKKINIGIVDGGGSRGIIPMVMYDEICNQLEDPDLIQKFDIFGGTSTGSILSAALLLKEKTPEQGIDLYKTLAPTVFGYYFGYYTSGFFSTLFGDGHWHRSSKLKEVLLNEFGTEKLEYYKAGKSNGNGGTYPHWFCVATDITSTQHNPYVFRNYDVPLRKVSEPDLSDLTMNHSSNVGSKFKDNYTLYESVLSSCSAPGYFSSYKMNGHTFCDGGLFANCPASIGLMEAKCLWPDSDVNCFVSLGTGISSSTKSGDSFKGLIGNYVGSVINTERSWDDFQRHSSCLKSFKTFRFNPPNLGDGKLDETDPEVFKFWIQQTKKYMQSPETKKKVETLRKYLQN